MNHACVMYISIKTRAKESLLKHQHTPLTHTPQLTYANCSEDIVENQLLKAALTRLLALRQLSPHVCTRLRVLRSRLDAVTDVGFEKGGAALPEVQFSHLNEHYAHALAMARFVLSHSSSMMFQHGILPMHSFLLSMPKTFEGSRPHAHMHSLSV